MVYFVENTIWKKETHTSILLGYIDIEYLSHLDCHRVPKQTRTKKHTDCIASEHILSKYA